MLIPASAIFVLINMYVIKLRQEGVQLFHIFYYLPWVPFTFELISILVPGIWYFFPVLYSL